jgi:very-short-patch-repair endonuclease
MAKTDNPIFNLPRQMDRRKKLRNEPTAAEYVLWQTLKGSKVLGKKFRRQCGIGPYIVDFYCSECRLIIELDGAPHFKVGADEYERARNIYLEGLGLQILRFENKVVFRNIEAVSDAIRAALESSPPRSRRS